jgi:hypothetical protein
MSGPMYALILAVLFVLCIPASHAFWSDGILNDVYRHGWIEMLSPKATTLAGTPCKYDPNTVDWQSMIVFYREVLNV